MRSITLLSTSVLVLFSLISCSNNSSSGSNSKSSKSVGAAGGTVESSDGAFKLTIPKDALTDEVEISVERFHSDVDDALFYELQPSGLEFLIPISMQIDVSEIVTDPQSDGVLSAPFVVSTDRNETGLEMLDNQRLLLDGDGGKVTLSADVLHFSRFMAAGDVSGKLHIEGVVQFAQIHSPFGPVELVVDNVDQLRNLVSIQYEDKSTLPVIYNGPVDPPALMASMAVNNRLLQSYPYQCGDRGVGTYHSDTSFNFQKMEWHRSYGGGDVDIGAAFLLGTVNDGYFEDEITYSHSSTHTKKYTFSLMRKVNCGGSAPVAEEDGATDNGSDSMAEEDGATDNGSDSMAGSDGGLGSGGTPTAPLISTTTGSINIQHIIGQTECPTFADPVFINTAFPHPVSVSVTEDLPFLRIDSSNASSTTSDGRFEFTPVFPCEGFTLGENTGFVYITAQDPKTGLLSNQLDIAVTVVVGN